MVRSPLTPWLFLAPLLVLLLFVFGTSFVRVVEFSLKMVRGIDGPWIGLRNYELVLGQGLFWEAVGHNLLLLAGIPVMVAFALLVALLLYERVAGWRLYRTILFVPYILAIPIIAVVMKQMFQFSGPVNELLRLLSLDFLALDWIGSTDTALWTVLGLIVWREAALGVVLFLSRLLALDETVVEAARLEGATWWQRARYVLIPQMRGIIEFFVVISVITMISAVFAYVYVMGGGRGGPGTSTVVVELYIYNALVRQSLPGVAAAVSVMLFLVSLGLIWLLFVVRGREEAA
jgi:ABC-type sugar transport system permease subunit